MIARPDLGSFRIANLSQRVFTRLLTLYPREYRQEYGPHMAQLFQDCSREALALSGTSGLITLWLSTLPDLFKTAFEEHLKELWHMEKERSIRIAGWAFMLGIVLFVFASLLGTGQVSTADPFGGREALLEYANLVIVTLAPLSLAAGAWLLRANYGAAVIPGAKSALTWATLAGGVSTVGAVLLGLQIDANGWAWGLFFIGFLAFMLGLGLFGLAAARKKLLPGFSTLLAIGGLSLPILAVVSVTLQQITGRDYVWNNGLLQVALLVALAAVFLVGMQLVFTPMPAKTRAK